jgi:hypothetical protein
VLQRTRLVLGKDDYLSSPFCESFEQILRAPFRWIFRDGGVPQVEGSVSVARSSEATFGGERAFL